MKSKKLGKWTAGTECLEAFVTKPGKGVYGISKPRMTWKLNGKAIDIYTAKRWLLKNWDQMKEEW